MSKYWPQKWSVYRRGKRNTFYQKMAGTLQISINVQGHQDTEKKISNSQVDDEYIGHVSQFFRNSHSYDHKKIPEDASHCNDGKPSSEYCVFSCREEHGLFSKIFVAYLCFHSSC